MNKTRKVTYYPPSDELIENYARAVSQKLIANAEDSANADLIWGFTGFLKVVARILASHLNKDSEEKEEKLDTREEDS